MVYVVPINKIYNIQIHCQGNFHYQLHTIRNLLINELIQLMVYYVCVPIM